MRTGNIKSRSYAHGLDALQTVPEGESMTRQDQADLCNINKIYARTQRGEIVLASSVMPTFGDFSNIKSYDQMLESIHEAEDAFMSLSSEERAKYKHDPAYYYAQKLQEASDAIEAEKEAQVAKEAKAAEEAKLNEARELLKKQQNSD